jgi:hypothetical protein
MTEQIELKINTDDNGQPYITDQHGRLIEGITHINVSSGVGELTMLTIDAYAYGNGKMVVGGPVNLSRTDKFHINISGPDASSATFEDTIKAINERNPE